MSAAPTAVPALDSKKNDVELQPTSLTAPDADNNNGSAAPAVTVPVADAAEKDGAAAAAAAANKPEDAVPPVPWSQLFRYADATDKWLYALGAFCAIVSGGGMPAFSFVFGSLITELSRPPTGLDSGGGNVTSFNGDKTNELALVMTIIGAIRGVLGLGTVVCFMVPCERQTTKIRAAYLEALLRLDMSFHDGAKPGALTAHLVGDVQIFRNGINDKLGMGILQIFMFIMGYGVAFYTNWRLSFVAVAMLPMVVIVVAILRHFTTKYHMASRDAFAKAGEVSDEAFQNFRTVQILGLEERLVQRFTDVLESGREAGLWKDISASFGVGGIFFVMFASYALVFYYAVQLVLEGALVVGDILTVFFTVLIGSFGVVGAMPTLIGLIEASGAIAKVFAVIDRTPVIVSGTKKLDGSDGGKELQGHIQFEDVSFVYPTKPDMKLFTNLTLDIQPGQHVAFSGASGCGKSSAIALVQRMYDPTHGRVLVDGVPLKELDLTWFRSQVGVVSQEPTLFQGTIEENVKLGAPDATRAEVEEACRMAAVHDTIMALPDGYETRVIADSLSGGQRQRVNIARALIKRPKILILDEATSALDRASEMEVQAAIDALMHDSSTGRKLTILVIAHRLVTIKNVHTIHFIEHDDVTGSHIVESGSFAELMAKGGHFAQMASRQAKSHRHTAAAGSAFPTADKHEGDASPAAAAIAAATATSSMMLSHESSGALASPQKSEVSEGGAASPGLDGAAAKALTTAQLRAAQRKRLEEEEEGKRLLQAAVDKEMEDADSGLWRVAGIIRELGCTCYVLLGVLGSFIQGGIMPAYSVALSKCIGIIAITPKAKLESEIQLWLVAFVIIAFASFCGHGLQSMYAVAGEKLTMHLRVLTLRHILRQDGKFFDTPGRDPGGLQGLLSGDCEGIHILFGPTIGPALQLFATLTAGLIISFIYSWKLALVLLAATPVLICASAARGKMQKGEGFSNKLDDKNPAASAFNEAMTNIRTIQAYNAQGKITHKFEEADRGNLDDGISTAWAGGFGFGFAQFGTTCIFALGLWFGGTLIRDGELTFGDMMICLMALLMAGMGSGEAAGLLAKQKDAAIGARRVFAVVDRIPDVELDATVGEKASDTFRSTPEHSIAFDKCCFSYPSRPTAQVLKGLTHRVPGGSSLGVAGSTGSGKSTILQLLARFYDPCPDKDTINVDEHHLRSINLRGWRTRIGAVFQEPSLFSGTIRENILFGVKNADAITDAQIEHVCKLACVHDDIVGMPGGYKTEIGFKARMLSGGQRSRTALARALLREPDLLLLDEVSAAWDSATEARVMDNLHTYVADKEMTVVSIAHRLSTIKNSDTILLLNDGVVLETGSHDELVARGGEYAKRWKLFAASTGDEEKH